MKRAPSQSTRPGIHLAVRLGLAALASFAFLAMATIWTPIQAQESPKKNAAQAEAKRAKAIAPVLTNFPGKGQKLDAQALTKIIDQEISKKLATEKVPASPQSTDTEYLRRVYLDITGIIPTPSQVTAFLNDTNPTKRAKIVEELLASSRYGTAQSELWSGLLIPRESNNRRLNHTPLQEWLAKSFNDNMPLDKLTFELLTAIGDQDKNGATTYFIGNPTVDKITDNVTKVFMGVQLQCAQCHNHPFTDYKQDDYWGMAAFFMRTKLTINVNGAAKKGIPPGIVETSQTIRGKGLPEAAKLLPPKYLQSDKAPVAEKDPYRPVLAKWVTDSKNPFFAKAMVNRFWYQYFGRGLVNPVDDMHDDNLPTHPELLASLTEQLKANNFDLKYLIRAITSSQAYQRSSISLADNKEDRDLYSHRIIRVLSPEQLYDSLTVVLANPGEPRKDEPRAKKGGPTGGREGFLNFFRIDEGNDPVEYQAGIPQALKLMNSSQINSTKVPVERAIKTGKTPQEIVENLFMTTLSRKPNPQEVERMVAFVGKAGDPRTGYNDIMWALLNSSEFALNH